MGYEASYCGSNYETRCSGRGYYHDDDDPGSNTCTTSFNGKNCAVCPLGHAFGSAFKKCVPCGDGGDGGITSFFWRYFFLIVMILLMCGNIAYLYFLVATEKGISAS